MAISTHDGATDDDGNQLYVESLDISMPAKTTAAKRSAKPAEYKPVLEDNVWGKLRGRLIYLYDTTAGKPSGEN